MRTHYDNLHIKESASLEVIKAAYKALAQKWHPDKNPDQREKAERYFKIITTAFELLSNPESRTNYDAWLKQQRSAAPQQPETESPQGRHDENMTEAREGGRRSREQGGAENDCPYSGELAGAWQQGFKAEQKISTAPKAAPHPWRRFFARFIDTLMLGFASTFLVSFLAALIFGVDLNIYWSGALLPWTAIWITGLVVIEAIFIHHVSTTPGKWLFGIRIYANNGGKLSLHNSFERALGVQIVGQGVGIPGLGLITYPLAYSRLNKTGSTFWDGKAKSKVECAPISAGRVTVCVLVTLVAMITNSLLIKAQIKESAASALANHKQPQSTPEALDEQELGKDKWLETVRQAEQQVESGELPMVTGAYVQGLPENSGLWPRAATSAIESKSIWWVYESGGFRVKITNASMYSMKTIRFEFDDKACGENNSANSFYVSLSRSINPGEIALVSLPNGGQTLSGGAENCLVVADVWDQKPVLGEKDTHVRQIYAAHPDADSIVMAPSFVEWTADNSEWKRILESGTADEVITLISAYKAHLYSRRPTQSAAPASSAAATRNPYPNCVIYSVMTDEDYAACGISPP